jgi:hypothetical protein
MPHLSAVAGNVRYPLGVQQLEGPETVDCDVGQNLLEPEVATSFLEL